MHSKLTSNVVTAVLIVILKLHTASPFILSTVPLHAIPQIDGINAEYLSISVTGSALTLYVASSVKR